MREPLARWGRAEPFRTMEESMRQMLNEALRWDPFGELEAPLTAGEVAFLPRTELKETGSAFVFSLEVPGVKQEDIDISCVGNRLTVSGEREEETVEEEETYHARERVYGRFSRSFTLPEGANLEQVTADLKHGVLHITVPKAASVKPRHIPIETIKGREEPKEPTEVAQAVEQGAPEIKHEKAA